VLAYLDWLHAYRRGKSGRALSEASILDAIPAKLKRRLPRIARRIIADILKRPVLSPT
jgi:phage terminase Nu1 subunit (DNA packaging protein)